MGKIYYLMGKSATGKDTVYERLAGMADLGLRPLVIWTTRPIRSGETDGVEYHFTDEEGMRKLEEAGKVIERRSYNTACGVWNYFTADDDSIDLDHEDYLAIGTPESWTKVRAYYGADRVVPVYIETEDGLRLERALKRERKQEHPKFEEMCRRFLADQQDFSEDNLRLAGITKRFANNGDLETCLENVVAWIRSGGEGGCC